VWANKIDEPFHAVEIQIAGKLIKEDYNQIVPVIETLILKRKISILVELLDFQGWSAGALWKDSKFPMRYFSNIDRIAVVGNRQWEDGMAAFCKPFTSAEGRYFDSANIQHAREWIKQNEI
jgi:hypothetical protein